MTHILHFLFSFITSSCRSRLSLQLEIAARRNQLSTYRLQGQRPRIAPADRLTWCVLAKCWLQWRKALFFAQPRTVALWQIKRFRDYWRTLSQGDRPGVDQRSRQNCDCSSNGCRGRLLCRAYGDIDEIITAPASPRKNPYVERVIGSIRRKLLDHVVVLNQRHLKRLLSSYLDYYHPWRTHHSLDQDVPDGPPVRLAKPNQIAEFPVVQELHHYYLPKAA